MPSARAFGIVLPQILLLFILTAWLDALFDWNHTDSAVGLLIILFLLNPVFTFILWVAEIISYYRQKSKADGPVISRFMFIAFGLLIESLVLDLFILSQLRMH
jgi:hypothetical protein